MAPAPSSNLVHSLDHPSGRHLRLLRRQVLDLMRQPPKLFLRSGQSRTRTPGAALQPSVVLEGPSPAPVAPALSGSVAPGAKPSVVPVGDSQPVDMTGNIVAAVIVIVLILGGLIGLVVGGEILRRRRTRAAGKRIATPPSKNSTRSLLQRAETRRDIFPYGEKMSTPLTRPPPVLDREHRRRLSDIWPIRSLSMALCNRRPCSGQIEHSLQRSPPMANPQTTWSEFSPVSLYVPPPRTVLSCIPEELEDCLSQTNSDMADILGVSLERQLGSGIAMQAQTNEPKSHQAFLDGSNALDSSVETGARDDDTKSLGSSAPDMTADGGDSNRSSVASLESLEDGNDRESLREEVFELRCAHTRSMQMNRGVLLSLGLESLGDSESPGRVHGDCGPSRPPSALDEGGGKEYDDGRELSLAMLGRNLSAVNLDEFPSPPSILPMIPSFVSSF